MDIEPWSALAYQTRAFACVDLTLPARLCDTREWRHEIHGRNCTPGTEPTLPEQLLDGADHGRMSGHINVIGPAEQLSGAALHDPQDVFYACQIFDIGGNKLSREILGRRQISGHKGDTGVLLV